MKTLRVVRALSAVVLIGTMGSFSIACGGGNDAKSANVTAGEMPEGESWDGVYFHPVYGYLHMQEQDSNVVGRWERADKSAWGELSGTKTGNVVHFTWKEHKVGMVGPAGESHGKGYFVYKAGKDGAAAELDGQYGVNDDETGSDWHNIKQLRMKPDLSSIPEKTNEAPPGAEQLQ